MRSLLFFFCVGPSTCSPLQEYSGVLREIDAAAVAPRGGGEDSSSHTQVVVN